MTDPKSHLSLSIPNRSITYNWWRAAGLGSAVWPLLSVFEGNFSWDWGLIHVYLYLALLSFFISFVLGFPALLLFFLTGYLLNRSQLKFSTYCIWQNTIHIILAISTFMIIDCYDVTDESFPYTTGTLFCVYTICGLFFWNKMYYGIYKTTFKPTQS